MVERFHPDVLAAHADFGGDLKAMQALYDRPDHIKRIEALEREAAELQQRLSTAYRVKAECNDEANAERRMRLEAEADLEFLYSLDGSLGSVREGMDITRACRDRAESAERKVAELETELARKHEAFSIAHDQAMENGQAAHAALSAKARLSEALRLASDFVNEASGTALGIAMSGSDHPNPDEVLLELSRKGMALASHLSAARAALSGSNSGWRECATEGCTHAATVHFERGGVGSHYCHACYMRVQALPAAPQPTGGE